MSILRIVSIHIAAYRLRSTLYLLSLSNEIATRRDHARAVKCVINGDCKRGTAMGKPKLKTSSFGGETANAFGFLDAR